MNQALYEKRALRDVKLIISRVNISFDLSNKQTPVMCIRSAITAESNIDLLTERDAPALFPASRWFAQSDQATAATHVLFASVPPS